MGKEIEICSSYDHKPCLHQTLKNDDKWWEKYTITIFLQKSQNHAPYIPLVLFVTNETNSELEESLDDSLEDHRPFYMANNPQPSQTQQGNPIVNEPGKTIDEIVNAYETHVVNNYDLQRYFLSQIHF